MGWLDALNPTATGALEWLPMLYKDPGLLVSIIETSKALAEQQTIRIDESIIEKAVLEECVPLSGLSITELACCGLRSNRLLLYGTLKERGLSHEFIAFISPAKSPVVWTDKAWTVTFEVDGPRMQAANQRTELIGSLADFVCGAFLPGLAYEIVKKTFERTLETTTKRRWIGSVASRSSHVRKGSGSSVVIDLMQNEALRNLASQQIDIPQAGLRIALSELVRIENITFDQGGVGVKCDLAHRELLEGYYSALLKQIGIPTGPTA